jgi:uncharacterized protein DUF4397
MKLSRIAAFIAIPAALSLGACGGGSTATIANATGDTANVRIVNGTPGLGTFDVYLQTTGSAAPSNPILQNVAYAVASDYLIEPAASASVLVQHAGGGSPGSGTSQLASCPIPQLTRNAKYSIVIVHAQNTVNCALFQDFDYTTAPQYRMHNASVNATAVAAGGLGFGVIPVPDAPAGSPFTVQGTAPLGNLSAGAAGAATGFTGAQPTSLSASSTSVTFAVGTGATGTTPSIATVDSKFLFAPNGTTQPNTSGLLNFTGSVGSSIFALDCTAAAIAAVPHAACSAGGTTLVGYTDRL